MTVVRVVDIEDRLERLERRRTISLRAIGAFQCLTGADGKSVAISFTLAIASQVGTITLVRNTTADSGSAAVVQDWSAPFADGDTFHFTDSDPLVLSGPVYYWLLLENDDKEKIRTVGPQSLRINFDSGIPDAISAFDASHGAAAGGVVRVNISAVAPAARFGSLKLYISGYKGVAAFVAIAQSSTLPFAFTLESTGEAVTLKAIAVSLAGLEAASGPTKALTLGAAATVPAQIVVTEADELGTSGVQIVFTAGAEINITTFQIWRSARGAGFGAASNIGTVGYSGALRYTFLDTTGLGGVYDWYVVAVNAAGSSTASAAFNQVHLNTSAGLPPNVPGNTTNFATVDSIDAGASATIRVYGTGGVNSDWVRQTGYGQETYPHAALTGFSYTTTYYVLYDKKNAVYVVTTSYPLIMPDNYAWAGKVTTVAAGGGGGTTGGGLGTGGGGGGGRGMLP